MSLFRGWRAGGARSVVAAIALFGASCGQSTPTDTIVDTDTTVENDGGHTESTVSTVSTVEIPPGEGLTLRLTGELADGLLCPGGQRPCFSLDRQPETTDGRVRLVGRLVDGVVIVASQEDVPVERTGRFPDECEGKRASGADRDGVLEAFEEYKQSIVDRYAILWVSQTNVLHVGVVGDAEDVEAAIADLGLREDLCVVGGFAKSEQELQGFADQIGDVVDQWRSEGRELDSFGWAPDPFEGAVVMDVFRVDVDMLASLAPIGDGAVRVNSAIEVLDGSLDDLAAALDDQSAELPAPDISIACGRVAFPTVPADIDGLAPLDADAEAALEGALAGPAAGEASYFVDEYTWSVVSRTEAELVLFGQPTVALDGAAGQTTPYASMTFDRVGDEWSVNGFGQCRLEVSALGLGPATVILDPDIAPDPTSTELAVLIRERACSGGQAPVDREIVPVVTETETTVELIVLVAPVIGGATCPGNPLHPITVTLQQPLGDRTVIDGATQPGVVRSWPPGQQDLDG